MTDNDYFDFFIERIELRFDSIIYGLEETNQIFKSIKDYLIDFRDIEGEKRYQRKVENYLNKLARCDYGNDSELNLININSFLIKYDIEFNTVLEWIKNPPDKYNTQAWINNKYYIPLYDLLALDKPELDMIFIESDDVSTDREKNHPAYENFKIYPFLNDYPTHYEITNIRYFFEKAIKDFYVLELINYLTNEIKTQITSNQIKTIKQRKTFSEYFLKNNGELELKKIVKIFNENESPMVYAMMICILTQKKIILIPNRGRTGFYNAWYDFIEKKHPLNDNYTGINDFIGDKSINGFLYIDPYDPEFLDIQETFEKEFNLN